MKNLKWYHWLLIAITIIALPFGAVFVLPFFKDKLKDFLPVGGSDRVRGMRNKNPFNLRISNNDWNGKIYQDKKDNEFEEFESIEYGLRAGLINCRTHVGRGKDTIRKLMHTLSPSHENPTDGFIDFIVEKSGIDPDLKIEWDKETAFAIAAPIVRFESEYKLTRNKFNEVWEML